MSQLIDALLSLAQVGRGELQPIDLDFSYLVQSVAGELAAANPERSVAITIAPRMRAYGDPRLLRIVVANLLENAWKFTGRREQPVVEVGLSQEHQDADVLRTRQRRRVRSGVRIETVRCIPASAFGPGISRDRDWSGDRPSGDRAAWRRGLGGVAAGAGRDVLFHVAEEVGLKPDLQPDHTVSGRCGSGFSPTPSLELAP